MNVVIKFAINLWFRYHHLNISTLADTPAKLDADNHNPAKHIDSFKDHCTSPPPRLIFHNNVLAMSVKIPNVPGGFYRDTGVMVLDVIDGRRITDNNKNGKRIGNIGIIPLS